MSVESAAFDSLASPAGESPWPHRPWPAPPGVHTLHLAGLRRPLFASGDVGLLARPIVALTGGRLRCSPSARRAQRLAGALARAGVVVAATAHVAFGLGVLAAAAAVGGAVVGMLHSSMASSFRPPLEVGGGSALWLSIFPVGYCGRVVVHDWTYDGPDAADRTLGTLAAAVVVCDTDGLPDAFDVAQAAVVAGRPVFFPRGAARRWPASLAHANVALGLSMARVLQALVGLVAPGGGSPSSAVHQRPAAGA